MGTVKKKTMIIVTTLVLLAFGAALAVHLIFSTNGLMLVAGDAVHVYATQEQAMTWPNPKAMTELSSGQSVPVTECVDVKHYLIYKIRLPDGRNGFVLDGNYNLMRDGKQAFCR